MKNQSLLDPVKKYWYLFVSYIAMSYILTQVVVNGSNRIAKITDQLFAGQPIVLGSTIQPFLWLTLIGTIAAFIKRYMQSTYSVNVQAEIKNRTVRKLVRLPYSYFDTIGTGSIINKLVTDVYQMEALFSEVIPEFVMAIVTIVTVAIYMFFMDARLLAVTIVCYPLLLWLANILSKKVRALTGSRRDLYDNLENTAMDTYQGMLVGRTYNLNEVIKVRIHGVVDAILCNEYTRTKVLSISQVIGNIIRWIPQVLCYLFALYEVFNGHLTVGTLLAFVILLTRIVNPFGEIPGYLNAIREQWVSFQRLNEIIAQPEEKSGDGVFKESFGAPLIELKDIEFSYNRDQTIFDHLNLKIEKGKQIALVGSSGGGKSTVFKILCGFYLPQKGSYQLYGHDYKEWDVNALRSQFALVSQNAYLFPGTIAENVSYGREGASYEEVVKACKKANIHEFIIGLPKGYETTVGERGAKLSGGQRQRISIARAFLKNAPVLLLDEPTSAVDVETENLIKEAIERISASKTVITIAHRLSTIEHADEIFVFDKGRIAEHGSHLELMGAGGLYYGLYEKEGEEG